MQTQSATSDTLTQPSTGSETLKSDTTKFEALKTVNEPKILSEKKKETDCWFFLNSECTKKEACEFRHSEAAKTNPKVCRNWMKTGHCEAGVSCTFRHPSKSTTHNIPEKLKIPCTFFMKGECLKGVMCPYLHQIPKQFVYINPQTTTTTTTTTQSPQEGQTEKTQNNQEDLKHSVTTTTSTITSHNTNSEILSNDKQRSLPSTQQSNTTSTSLPSLSSSSSSSQVQINSNISQQNRIDRLSLKQHSTKGTKVKLFSSQKPTSLPFRVKTLEELLKEEEEANKKQLSGNNKNDKDQPSSSDSEVGNFTRNTTKRPREKSDEEHTTKRPRQSESQTTKTTTTTKTSHSMNEPASTTKTETAISSTSIPSESEGFLTETELELLQKIEEDENDTITNVSEQ